MKIKTLPLNIIIIQLIICSQDYTLLSHRHVFSKITTKQQIYEINRESVHVDRLLIFVDPPDTQHDKVFVWVMSAERVPAAKWRLATAMKRIFYKSAWGTQTYSRPNRIGSKKGGLAWIHPLLRVSKGLKKPSSRDG